MLSHHIHVGQDSRLREGDAQARRRYTRSMGRRGARISSASIPSMLYKPTRAKDSGDVTYEASEAADDRERERLERCGFIHGGKGAALAALEKQEFEFAELAANRAVTDQRMGELARAEAVRVDDATIQHLPVIPEKNDRPDHMKGARK